MTGKADKPVNTWARDLDPLEMHFLQRRHTGDQYAHVRTLNTSRQGHGIHGPHLTSVSTAFLFK